MKAHNFSHILDSKASSSQEIIDYKHEMELFSS